MQPCGSLCWRAELLATRLILANSVYHNIHTGIPQQDQGLSFQSDSMIGDKIRFFFQMWKTLGKFAIADTNQWKEQFLEQLVELLVQKSTNTKDTDNETVASELGDVSTQLILVVPHFVCYWSQVSCQKKKLWYWLDVIGHV